MSWMTVKSQVPLPILIMQRHGFGNWRREICRHVNLAKRIELLDVDDEDHCYQTAVKYDFPGLALLEAQAELDTKLLQLIVQLTKARWRVIVVGRSNLQPFELRFRQCGAVQLVTSLFDFDKVTTVIDKIIAETPPITMWWQDDVVARLPWPSARRD